MIKTSFLDFLFFPFGRFLPHGMKMEKLGTLVSKKSNFYNVLEGWGIARNEVQRQIEGHQSRITVSIFVIIAGCCEIVVGLGVTQPPPIFSNHLHLFIWVGVGTIFYGFFQIIVSGWRIRIYTARKFIPFMQWVGLRRVE